MKDIDQGFLIASAGWASSVAIWTLARFYSRREDAPRPFVSAIALVGWFLSAFMLADYCIRPCVYRYGCSGVYYLAGLLLLSLLAVRISRLPCEERRRRCQGMLIGLLTVLLFLPLAPYATVDVQTLVFYPALRQPSEDAFEKSEYPGPVRTAKLILLTKSRAAVYVVSPTPPSTIGLVRPRYRGCLIKLCKTGGTWKAAEPVHKVWEDDTNIDDTVFPPYIQW